MMRKLITHCRFVSVLSLAVLGCSCQQHVMSTGGAGVGTRTYADSVVHLGQVDPAYRPYFQSQHGANYSIADQRKAYLAAAQTARTPVRESDYHPGDVRSSKKSVAAKGSRARGSKAKTAVAGAKKKSPVKKNAVAVKKQATRRR